ncbi:MAG: hypothetical protein JXN60_06610 [Lentisphaerae bacterium]|nr:hypothetical protein [Lentisphaerota bacterium]
MSNDDLETNKKVRRVLVRHWIDLGRLSVRATGATLFVRGELARIAGMQEPLSVVTVEAMFTEIQRMAKIQRLSVDLSNWTNANGRWMPIDKDNQQINPLSIKSPATSKTYSLDTNK